MISAKAWWRRAGLVLLLGACPRVAFALVAGVGSPLEVGNGTVSLSCASTGRVLARNTGSDVACEASLPSAVAVSGSDLTLKSGTAPTAEGRVEWSSTGELMVVGDGASTRTFAPAVVFDVMRYGAACDGATNDQAAIAAAFVAARAVGGAVFVPAGKVCMVASDVTLASDDSLVCGAGGTIKATAAGTFTNAVLYGAAVSRVTIGACLIDLNERNIDGVKLATSGGGHSFVGLKVRYGVAGTDVAGTNVLASVTCSTSPCLDATAPVFECGPATAATNTRKGLFVSSSGGVATRALKATSCGAFGIDAATGGGRFVDSQITTGSVSGSVGIKAGGTDGTLVHGGSITTTSFGGNCVLTTGSYARVTNLRVGSGGLGSVGVRVEGTFSTVSDVTAVVTGNSAVGFRQHDAATNSNFNSNIHYLTGASSIGYVLNAAYAVVDGCQGVSTAGESHVVSGNQQHLISGCYLQGANYGVVPGTPPSGGSTINTRVYASMLVFQAKAGVILDTGWHVAASTINWIATTTGEAAIWLGDNRASPIGGCTTHSVISGNHLHTNTAGARSLIRAPHTRTTVAECSGIVITGNEFMGVSDNDATNGNASFTSGGDDAENAFISLAMGYTANQTQPALRNIAITGNTFLTVASKVDVKPIAVSDAFVTGSAPISDVMISGNSWDRSVMPLVANWSAAYGINYQQPKQACILIENAQTSAGAVAFFAPTEAVKITNIGCYCDLGCSPTMAILTLRKRSGDSSSTVKTLIGNTLCSREGQAMDWQGGGTISNNFLTERQVVEVEATTNGSAATNRYHVCAIYE